MLLVIIFLLHCIYSFVVFVLVFVRSYSDLVNRVVTLWIFFVMLDVVILFMKVCLFVA